MASMQTPSGRATPRPSLKIAFPRHRARPEGIGVLNPGTGKAKVEGSSPPSPLENEGKLTGYPSSPTEAPQRRGMCAGTRARAVSLSRNSKSESGE